MKEEEEEEQRAAASTTTKKRKLSARKRRFEQEKAAVLEKTSKLDIVEDTLVLSTDREAGRARLSTAILGLDCEYVGVGTEGRQDALARVSIVNAQGKVVFDKFVKPGEKVTDFRTAVSGVRPSDIVNAETFKKVRSQVNSLIASRIIVGHAVHNDFRLIRDTAKLRCLREAAGVGAKPSLRVVAEKLLGIVIQEGEHDSVIDARVALRIYQLHKKKIEDEINQAIRLTPSRCVLVSVLFLCFRFLLLRLDEE